MITSLGNFLRRLRLANGEILKTMAERLEVSSAFLSAVENGKKKMPESWTPKLRTLYRLTESQIEELQTAEIASRESIELHTKNVSNANRELAILFARRFDDLDEKTSRRILEILKEQKGGQ